MGGVWSLNFGINLHDDYLNGTVCIHLGAHVLFMRQISLQWPSMHQTP
jgi:hypothetical protein